MNKRLQSGSFTMEAVAVISCLCIAAIFIFSHMSRQADADDQMAALFAQKVREPVTRFFSQNPQAKITQDALAMIGLKAPAPLQMEIPQGHEQASDWLVWVWHPEGLKRFEVSSQKVVSEPR